MQLPTKNLSVSLKLELSDMSHKEKLCDRNEDIFKQMNSKVQNKNGIL